MTGRKQEITLQKDFDAVVTYGDTVVELHTDGSTVVKIGGHSTTYANGNVSAQPAPLPVVHNDEEYTRILDLAVAEARKYGHATVGFNHVLAAIIKVRPQELADILGPKFKVSTLAAMLDKDMGQIKSHPQDLVPGSTFRMGPETFHAMENARATTRHWRTDRLYAAELLYSMLSAGKVRRDERSITLDYIDMSLSNYRVLNAYDVSREAIDKYAGTIGEAFPKSGNSPPDLRSPC